MACEVTFMGGPANGEIRYVPGDEPPKEFTFQTAPNLRLETPPGEFTYVCQVSTMDDGPLWVYVPKDSF